jgi:hypothetical protein
VDGLLHAEGESDGALLKDGDPLGLPDGLADRDSSALGDANDALGDSEFRTLRELDALIETERDASTLEVALDDARTTVREREADGVTDRERDGLDDCELDPVCVPVTAKLRVGVFDAVGEDERRADALALPCALTVMDADAHAVSTPSADADAVAAASRVALVDALTLILEEDDAVSDKLAHDVVADGDALPEAVDEDDALMLVVARTLLVELRDDAIVFETKSGGPLALIAAELVGAADG